MAQIARGEIWQFSFPKPDRKRPVLILTRNDMIDHLQTVSVAPITSTVRGVSSEVVVGVECGLKKPSAINLHHIATVPKAGLRSFVGTLPASVMADVGEALLFALGFSYPADR